MGYPIPSHDFPFCHHKNSQNGGKPLASNASARPQDAAGVSPRGKASSSSFRATQTIAYLILKKTKSIQDWMLLGTFGRGPE